MVTKQQTGEVNFLNEKGLQLIGLKNVLLENKENPLVFETLVSSLVSSGYEKPIYDGLVDTNVSSPAFNQLLLTSDAYTNLAELKKMYQVLQKNLSVALERRGVKYFSTDTVPNKGGVLVIRKFGISLDFMKREFRLTEREAKKLLKDGFMEKYAELKLNAIMKDMVASVEKAFPRLSTMEFDTSSFYFNEEQNVYNIDFLIVINGQKHLKAKSQEMSRLYTDVENVLKHIQKEYFRRLHHSKEA